MTLSLAQHTFSSKATSTLIICRPLPDLHFLPHSLPKGRLGTQSLVAVNNARTAWSSNKKAAVSRNTISCVKEDKFIKSDSWSFWGNTSATSDAKILLSKKISSTIFSTSTALNYGLGVCLEIYSRLLLMERRTLRNKTTTQMKLTATNSMLQSLTKLLVIRIFKYLNKKIVFCGST